MMMVQRSEAGFRLSELLAGENPVRLQQDPVVTGITLDSRTVRPGDLFLAVRGTRIHGQNFIMDAITRGAVAVLRESRGDEGAVELCKRIPVVSVSGLRHRAGGIASRFYSNPAASMKVVGITGTNGKTSCCHFLAQALSLSAPAGVIGTLGYGLYGALRESGNTTPDAVTLQGALADFRDRGARHTVMEVSSHGLDQGRVQGVAFDTAVFTNLSRDHLDYHGDMNRYGAAKRRLFSTSGLRNAVINADDPFGRELLASLPAGVNAVGYSLEGRSAPPAMVSARDLVPGSGGVQMRVYTPWGEGHLESPLLGRFNAGNLLAALATLLCLDVPLGDAIGRLSRVTPVAGRMEAFRDDGGPLVVVDYAHTPAALEQVLEALQEHGRRLWCVFGCGGERDKGKRPLMGAIAERFADRVMITDDNPRGEEPEQIVADILKGMRQPDAAAVCHDRAAAIERVIHQADAEDVILIAGKGHESFQQLGGVRRPFSDRDVVRRVVGERREKHG